MSQFTRSRLRWSIYLPSGVILAVMSVLFEHLGLTWTVWMSFILSVSVLVGLTKTEHPFADAGAIMFVAVAVAGFYTTWATYSDVIKTVPEVLPPAPVFMLAILLFASCCGVLTGTLAVIVSRVRMRRRGSGG